MKLSEVAFENSGPSCIRLDVLRVGALCGLLHVGAGVFFCWTSSTSNLSLRRAPLVALAWRHRGAVPVYPGSWVVIHVIEQSRRLHK